MDPGPERQTATQPVCCLAHCTGCGACVPACPHKALSLVSELPGGRGAKRGSIAAARCTGCGVCVPACPRQALATPATRQL